MMAFDALMLAAVRDELRAEIVGGIVQRVVQTGPLSIGLEVYAQRRRHFLVCSAEPDHARVCLSAARPARESDKPTPLLLLLRKYVRDGRITGVDQVPLERVLTIRVARTGKDGHRAEVGLIIEVMGRRSNVLLVGDDQTILSAARLTSAGRNPRRPILPGRSYALPPAQTDRLHPLESDTLRPLAPPAPTVKLTDLLRERILGCSPTLAREIVYRAHGRLDVAADSADWQRLGLITRELCSGLEHGPWRPTVAYLNGVPLDFAPYPLTHLPDAEVVAMDSASAAVEVGMAARSATLRPLVSPERRGLLREIDQASSILERKRDSLQRELAEQPPIESIREQAEALLASVHSIQAGQTVLRFDELTIELDPSLSPLENAQRLFTQYRKARQAGAQIPDLITRTNLELQHTTELRALVETGDSPASIRAIRAELATLRGHPPAPLKRAKKGTRGKPEDDGAITRRHTPVGLEVLLGASARGNQVVTFKLAGPNDLWLHARGVPGAHVILRTGGSEPSSECLQFAARLAARHSHSRLDTRVEVDYTARKHVRKISGAPPGLVTYREERTIVIDNDQSVSIPLRDGHGDQHGLAAQ